MISILIPIYNYNAVPLVKELYRQCAELSLEFEIICIDDCSALFQHENKAISSMENCSLHILEQNIGRSSIRNLLAKKATQEWLLFLDCDLFPKNKLFIKYYIDHIRPTQSQAAYGGLLYHDNKPKDDQLLRWVYGRKREVKSTSVRVQQPYQTSLVSNFLIQKRVFSSVQFNESNSGYGYEDSLFMQYLQRKKILIDQIENPVFHLNIETSILFLTKTKEALRTLLSLHQNNIKIETKITKTFTTIDSLKLVAIVAKLFNKVAPVLENNLLSKKPSMFVFDLYKIGYFCYLNQK